LALYRAETKPISRKDGRSAVAAAAYRSGASLVDDRTGNAHDYTRRRGVVATGIITPDGQGCERNALWNGAEAAEKRKDGRTAREWVLALPDELTDQQRLDLTAQFSRSLAERFGVAVDFAIHRPGKEGDQRNHHAHVLTTTRQISRDASGALVFGDKAQPELSDAQLRKQGIEKGAVLVEEVRALWEAQANSALEGAGEAARIDRRSLKARGVDRAPTVHLGPSVTALERRGRKTDAGNINRAIEQDNERKAALTAEIIDLQAERERLRAQAARDEEQRRKQRAAFVQEWDDYLKPRKSWGLDQLRREATDELARGEVGLREGMVKDTSDYAQKTKEIRDLEARITQEERNLANAQNRFEYRERAITEWSEGTGFFARLRPPPEIREKKEQAAEIKIEIRQITGVLTALKAALDRTKQFFRDWFQAEVKSPNLDARLRLRSLTLTEVIQRCEKVREKENLRLKEEHTRWLEQVEASRKRTAFVTPTPPVPAPKQPASEPPPPVADSPEQGDDFEDDWDDSPSLGM